MNPIHQTAKDFAVTAVKLGKRLQTQEREFNISSQLIRSATSISANLHEARSSESLKDYTHKVFIDFKEASEQNTGLTFFTKPSISIPKNSMN
jgi:four helix bundle protein